MGSRHHVGESNIGPYESNCLDQCFAILSMVSIHNTPEDFCEGPLTDLATSKEEATFQQV